MNIASNRIVSFFLPIAIVAVGICYIVINSASYHTNTNLFSLAVTFDLVIFVPFVYYLFIRKTNVHKITIIPVVFISFAVASFILPAQGHTYIKLAEFLVAPLELFTIGFLVYKVRLASKEYKLLSGNRNDFVINLKETLYKFVGNNRGADYLATEMSIFYYGIGGWNKTIEAGSEKAFSYHKRSGYGIIAGVFFFMMIIETTALHLLITRWSTAAAWVLTILSIYGILFLIADYNAAKKRPILVDDGHLYIRIAFRWHVVIPFENIKSISVGTEKNKEDKSYFRMVMAGSENIIIELFETQQAKGIYGITKNFSRLGLSIDDKKEFIASIPENTQID